MSVIFKVQGEATLSLWNFWTFGISEKPWLCSLQDMHDVWYYMYAVREIHRNIMSTTDDKCLFLGPWWYIIY